MLTVKKIIFLSIIFIFFNINVIAKDVSNFDIRNISLGDNYDSIKNKVPCNDFEKTTAGNTSYIFRLDCGGKHGSLEGSYLMLLDHKGRMYSMIMTQGFSVEPNYQHIENQIYSKYGQPDKATVVKTGSKNPDKGEVKFFCWGSCRESISNDSSLKGTMMDIYGNGKVLLVKYASYKYTKQETNYYIDFQLHDNDLSNEHDKWRKYEYEKFKNYKRKKESNLNL